MKFSEIAGHERPKSDLRTMVDQGRIPHAILIHGPSGLGKMRLARAFVQYVMCENRHNGDSCGQCPSCLQTRALNNPDVHYSYPIIKGGKKTVLSQDYSEQWKEMLSEHSYMQPEIWNDILNAGNSQPTFYTEESEEIARLSAMSAYAADKKIFVIWLPEKMSAAVANKLLKLVEEPHSDTIFVMVSNSASEVLPTIYSRLQRIETNRLSDADIYQWLSAKGADDARAREITRLSLGIPAKAEELLEEGGERHEFEALFQSAMRNAYAVRVDNLKDLSEQLAAMGREKAIRFLTYFTSQIRENYIANLRNPSLLQMTHTELQFSSRFAPFIHSGNVEDMIAEADRARTDISRNANAKVVWFDFLLWLTRLIRRGMKN